MKSSQVRFGLWGEAKAETEFRVFLYSSEDILYILWYLQTIAYEFGKIVTKVTGYATNSKNREGGTRTECTL